MHYARQERRLFFQPPMTQRIFFFLLFVCWSFFCAASVDFFFALCLLIFFSWFFFCALSLDALCFYGASSHQHSLYGAYMTAEAAKAYLRICINVCVYVYIYIYVNVYVCVCMYVQGVCSRTNAKKQNAKKRLTCKKKRLTYGHGVCSRINTEAAKAQVLQVISRFSLGKFRLDECRGCQGAGVARRRCCRWSGWSVSVQSAWFLGVVKRGFVGVVSLGRLGLDEWDLAQ